jgi:hypothetical protein
VILAFETAGVKPEEWKQFMAFANHLVNKMPITLNGMHTAIVKFSRNATVTAGLMSTKAQLLDKIAKTMHHQYDTRGQANFDQAITAAELEIATNGRAHASRVIVIFASGAPSNTTRAHEAFSGAKKAWCSDTGGSDWFHSQHVASFVSCAE